MAALYDIKEELGKVVEWKRDQDKAGDTQDGQGLKVERLVPANDQLLEEELKGKGEFEEEQKKEGAKGEEAQEENWAEGVLACEEDVPDRKGTAGPRPRKDGLNETSKGEQLSKDNVDALCSVFIQEKKMIKKKGK